MATAAGSGGSDHTQNSSQASAHETGASTSKAESVTHGDISGTGKVVSSATGKSHSAIATAVTPIVADGLPSRVPGSISVPTQTRESSTVDIATAHNIHDTSNPTATANLKLQEDGQTGGGGMSTGNMMAAIAAPLAGLVLLGVAFFLWIRRHRNSAGSPSIRGQQGVDEKSSFLPKVLVFGRAGRRRDCQGACTPSQPHGAVAEPAEIHDGAAERVDTQLPVFSDDLASSQYSSHYTSISTIDDHQAPGLATSMPNNPFMDTSSGKTPSPARSFAWSSFSGPGAAMADGSVGESGYASTRGGASPPMAYSIEDDDDGISAVSEPWRQGASEHEGQVGG